jgi:hypothetical protein
VTQQPTASLPDPHPGEVAEPFSARAARQAPTWSIHVLLAAGAYHLAWGTLVVAFPSNWFHLLGVAPPLYPSIWQGVGLIAAAYGIGYFIAAYHPFKYWPIIFVGLLMKVLGPAGFVIAARAGELPWSFGWTLIPSDLIWWLPFAAILYLAARSAQTATVPAYPPQTPLNTILDQTTTSAGTSLKSLSDQAPVMLVFLRHLGCIFLMEALHTVARRRAAIEAEGTQLVLVHMSHPQRAAALFRDYGMEGVKHVSDPHQRLYGYFRLQRGSFRQLFGSRVIWGALRAFVTTGRIGGRVDGDGFQLPGLVVVYRGEVIDRYLGQNAADQPDYMRFTRSADESTTAR